MIALCQQDEHFSSWYTDAVVDMFTVDLATALEQEQDFVNHQQSHDYSLGGTRTPAKATKVREADEAELAELRKAIEEFKEFIAQGTQPITNDDLNKALTLFNNGLRLSDAFKIAPTL